MLFFNRAKALKNIEEGIHWRSCGAVALPVFDRYEPQGVLVNVPEYHGLVELDEFIRALAAESAHVLGGASAEWVKLTGPGVASLPIDGMRAVLRAACPTARSAVLDIAPAMLEPGVIAGYRSVSVERFNFRVDGPFAGLDEPVRRARALGAFVSVEVCLGGELAGRAFLQAVERAVAASPNQISVSDERVRGAFGAEYLERAGNLCEAAGFRRVSLWAWAQGAASFDGFGMFLSGGVAALGPGAANAWPRPYRNPARTQWAADRLNGVFTAAGADGRMCQWLDLVCGLYNLDLQRQALSSRMHRHASALERIGLVDRQGKPANGSAMEFCHRAARAARQALLGCPEADMQEQSAHKEVLTARRRG